jgi:hypothetical protein
MAIEDGTTTTVGSSDLDLKCEIIDETHGQQFHRRVAPFAATIGTLLEGGQVS